MSTPDHTPTSPNEDIVPEEVLAYFDVDQAQEEAEFERLHQRNRKRILIPLGLLITLYFILSLFGDPLKDDRATPPIPTDSRP